MADRKSEENYNGYEDLEVFGDDSSKIKTLAIEIDGILTDFVLCDYSDRQLLIITQFQKIGTFISVVKGTASNLNGTDNIFDVRTICGLDNEEYHLATRYLSQQLGIFKPVLFGICLKDTQLKTLQTIVKALKEYHFY